MIQTFSPALPATATRSAAAPALPAPCQWAPGELHVFHAAAHPREIRVLSGTLWITATPAHDDWLVGAGEVFRCRDQAPYLVEALDTARVVLVQ